jgi:hypothetical protein
VSLLKEDRPTYTDPNALSLDGDRLRPRHAVELAAPLAAGEEGGRMSGWAAFWLGLFLSLAAVRIAEIVVLKR